MAWPEANVVTVLADESERCARVALGLREPAFARPTRCPPWDVKALIGHLYRDVDRIIEYRDVPAGPPDTDAVSYWVRYDPVGDAPDIAARAISIANGYATGAELARAFDRRWREAVEAARAMEPGRPIRTFAPTMRLDEFMKTRVLEMVVHGLDLARALDREPWTTPAGGAVVRDILARLLGGQPPSELGWDDVAFAEAGTGRRTLTKAERRALGDRAGRLPLLS